MVFFLAKDRKYLEIRIFMSPNKSRIKLEFQQHTQDSTTITRSKMCQRSYDWVSCQWNRTADVYIQYDCFLLHPIAPIASEMKLSMYILWACVLEAFLRDL